MAAWLDTGPDPDEVKARVKVIKRHFNRSLKYLEKYGAKDKRTIKAQGDVADQIMELKLAPKHKGDPRPEFRNLRWAMDEKVFNIKTYGAIGDGVTMNTESV